MKNLIILIITALTLQGCIFVAGAAAGAAGIAVVYDHRTIEKVMKDQKISNCISDRISVDTELADNSHINVSCFNQVVLLTGEAISPELRARAENIAQAVPGVTRVYNQILVKGPSSSLTRTSDAWITTKIKTQMLATKGLQSGTIKVVTENGTVYLMGIVSHDQANITVNIAREVSGVQKVVRVFQYTD